MPKYVWTPAIEDIVLSSLSQGQTLREVCRRIGISHSTVYLHEREDEAFGERIARAREDGERALEDECLTIADDATNDFVARMTGEGEIEMVVDRDHIARSKLRIETRMKLLAIKNPRRYGTNRLDVTSGGDPLPAADVEGMSTRLASIIAEGEKRRAAAESSGE